VFSIDRFTLGSSLTTDEDAGTGTGAPSFYGFSGDLAAAAVFFDGASILACGAFLFYGTSSFLLCPKILCPKCGWCGLLICANLSIRPNPSKWGSSGASSSL